MAPDDSEAGRRARAVRDHLWMHYARPLRTAGARGGRGAQHQRLPAPEHLRDNQKAFGRWAADRVEEAIQFEGPDTVAAVFVAPVQNRAGAFMRISA